MGASQSTIDNDLPPTYNEVFDDCPTTGWSNLEVGLIVGVTVAALCLTLTLVLCAPILGSIWKSGQYNQTFRNYCNPPEDDEDVVDEESANITKLLTETTAKIVRGAGRQTRAPTPSTNNV
jgi:hypothetical protein